ncbi:MULTISPECIES: serine/threonine-protein kinase [unclassified Frankia]|uniref:WD40 repeat domain-containing serine/threonine protein kinase n=1 Tax=unclassified Frankia TaxID=2632575 RepID=UPI002AD329EA|nr:MULTISPECIES: serine/threonine-protein kinase [unclassified Frankia]
MKTVADAAPRSASPLHTGDPRRLGPYHLHGRLGQGGMGTVYLGRRPDGPLVAVKMIRPDFARAPEFRERFRREAVNARRVARFCTAAVLDADPDADQPYLVTEYVEGLTLSVTVSEQGPLRSTDLELLAVNVATALTAIHNAGVTHGDLTPSNVLVSAMGPKVIDFGMARTTALTTISGDKQRIGTPGFMAPEQIVGDEITPAVDVFAWGGVVLYAGTGRLPFGQGPTDALLYRAVHTQPCLDGLDDELSLLVEEAMGKNPAERPSAQNLLVRLLGDPSIAETVLTEPASPPHASPAERRPHQPGVTPIASFPAPAAANPSTPSRSQGQARSQAPARIPAPSPASAPPTPPRPQAPQRPQTPTPTPTPPTPNGWPSRPSLPARWWRWVVGKRAILAGLFACILVAGTLATVLTSRSSPGRSQDASRRLTTAADTQRAKDPALAARLSLAAWKLSPTPEARLAMITSFVWPSATPVAMPTKSVRAVALSSDGRLLAGSGPGPGSDGIVALFDATSHAPVMPAATLSERTGQANSMAISPDGRLLATAGPDSTARLTDVSDPYRPAALSTLAGHIGPLNGVAFSPDGRTVATASDDRSARLWDVSDPRHPMFLTSLYGHLGPVQSVAFAPDGRILATASVDGTARLWGISDRQAPRSLATITGHNGVVEGIAFNQDGHLLATGGDDHTARLWDVSDPARPAPDAVLTDHLDWVTGVAFGGAWLATASLDATVGLVDVTSPRDPVLARLTGAPAGGVQTVAFDAGGETLATAGNDATIRLLRLDPTRLAAAACADPGNHLTPQEWSRFLPDTAYRPPCG